MTFGGNSCDGVPAPDTLPFITAALSLGLALLTIPGNFLVCLAVWKDPYKCLRTPFTFFVINLAISDLIVGMVVEPLSIYMHFREGFSLKLNNVWSIHMSYFISCTASVLNLAALTVDRFTAISHPLQYRARLTITRACIIAAVIWLVSFALPFIYFEVGYLLYTFVFANTAIAFTLIIFLATYVGSLKSMRAQVMEWNMLRDSSQTEENRAKIRAAAFERNITQVFVVMLGLFLCCYTPSLVMIYLMNLCSSCSCYTIHICRDMQFIFVLCSSALNPFIYAWRLPNFRKAFIKILRWRKGNQEIAPANTVSMGNTATSTVESAWLNDWNDFTDK